MYASMHRSPTHTHIAHCTSFGTMHKYIPVHCGIVWRSVCIDGLVHHILHLSLITTSLWMVFSSTLITRIIISTRVFCFCHKIQASERICARTRIHTHTRVCTLFLSFHYLSRSISMNCDFFSFVCWLVCWFEAFCDTISLRYEIKSNKVCSDRHLRYYFLLLFRRISCAHNAHS